MSTPATIQAGAGAFSFSRAADGVTAFQTIFTVPNISPVLIESVYFVADATAGAIVSEAIVLQIAAPGNVVVFAQTTPIMNQVGSGIFTEAVCTWARGATGLNQGAGMNPTSVDVTPPVYNIMPLPEMVVPPLSTIQVALYEDSGGQAGLITVSNIAVTYTTNAGPVSTSDLVAYPQPYLVPATG